MSHRLDKKIVYTIEDRGVNGRARPQVVYAGLDEAARDAVLKDQNKTYRQAGERIVDFVAARKAALAKLDTIDRLVLRIEEGPENPRG